MSYTENKLISLTSQSASQYFNSTYLSNVLFNTPGLVVSKPNIRNIELCLVHAEIPVSFYNINYTNNQFKYKLGTGSITIVSIPVGNYNANTLITAMITAINNVAFTITINKITGVLTFNYNASFIIYTDNANTIAKILGFTISSVGFMSVSNSTIAPYPLNLLGIKKLNICSSKLVTNNYITGVGSTSLLASLSVDQSAFGLIIYQNQGGARYTLSNKDILSIDILISDESFNLINFNNIDWSLVFSISVTYDFNIDPNSALIPITPPPQQDIKLDEKPDEKPNKNMDELEFLTK